MGIPMRDPVLQNEISHHVRESRDQSKYREYERYLAKTRAYINAPENRDEVRAAVRPLLAHAIRERRSAWESSEIDALCSRDSQMRAFLNNEPQTRDIGPAAVHVNQLLSNLSVRYANPDYIGELIIPPTMVDKESNVYAVYNERDNLAFPSNDVGPEGDLPEIDQSIDLTNSYQVIAKGVMKKVTPRTIANADSPINPLLDAQLLTMEANAFNREIAAAELLTTTGNYASANVTAISAGDEWDSAGGGNPVKVIMDLSKSIWRTRGVRKIGFCSIDTFAVLSRHAAILDVNKYQKTGFLTVDLLRQYFMLDELYVGEAWKDTANKGQTASYSRMWNDSFGVVGQQPAGGSSLQSFQFASRFRRGAANSETLFVPHKGYEGVFYVKDRYMEQLKVIASRAGAIATNALA